MNFRLVANNISKSYDFRENVFSRVSLEIRSGDITGILGPNGSGKSTLLKILAGLIKPTEGETFLEAEGKKVPENLRNLYFGFAAPYVNLYEEFDAAELLKFASEAKGLSFDEDKAREKLEEFGLLKSSEKRIYEYSSGMRQRLKLCLATFNEPAILFLDEPFSNLDESGIAAVEKAIEKVLSRGGAAVIASNDERETEKCRKFVKLEPNY